MTRTVRTDRYFYVYSDDENDMLWYSPSSDDEKVCNQNLLNCIEEARRILRQKPGSNISVCIHSQNMCGEYEDGEEWDATLADPDRLDALESKVRENMKKTV